MLIYPSMGIMVKSVRVGWGGGAGEEMRARAPGSTQHQQPPKGAKTVPKGRKCGQLEQDQVIKLRTKAKPVNRIDKLSLAHTLLERLDEFTMVSQPIRLILVYCFFSSFYLCRSPSFFSFF